jgi:hypothetical protein
MGRYAHKNTIAKVYEYSMGLLLYQEVSEFVEVP